MKIKILAVVLLSFSVQCLGQDAVSSAVANGERPEADSDRDGARKPAQVLDFFGIEPGMRVLDVFAGGGYYSEILSYLVGPGGSVALYNNGGWDGFVGAGVAERLAGDRLSNVESVVAETDATDFAANSFDAIVFVLGFHDLYYVDTGWPAIDADAFLGALYDSLKPGGHFGIVDHAANPGVSISVANSLHRIDPLVIRSDMVRAGFEFVGEADFLRNSDDPRNISMADPSIQGKTDRVVQLYRKP